MTGSNRKFFSGSTVQQAVLNAARYHQCEPEEVAYRELEKRHGFLRARKSVVIEVDPVAPLKSDVALPGGQPALASSPPVSNEQEKTQPERQTQPQAIEREESLEPVVRDHVSDSHGRQDEPREARGQDRDADRPEVSERPERGETDRAAEREELRWRSHEPGSSPPTDRRPDSRAEEGAERTEERSEERDIVEERLFDRDLTPEEEEIRESIEEAASQLLGLAKLQLTMQTGLTDDGWVLELRGVDRGRLVDRDGRAMLAVQHLLPRLLWNEHGETVAVRVDSEGFHRQREDRLRAEAEKAAQNATRRGRPWRLAPMPPDARRIVHIALAENPEVETESIGEGFIKRVSVRPLRESRPARRAQRR